MWIVHSVPTGLQTWLSKDHGELNDNFLLGDVNVLDLCLFTITGR